MGYLGPNRYGLVLTVLSISGWLAIADGGFAISMKNMLLKIYASDSGTHEEKTIVSGAFFLSLAFAAILGLIAAALIATLPLETILNISSVTAETRNLLGVSILLVLLTVPLGLARQIQASRQQEYESAPSTLLGIIAGLLVAYLATRNDWGLVVAGSGVLIGTVIGSAANMLWIQTRESLIGFWSIKREQLRELVAAGAAFWVIQLGTLLIFQSSIFIANLIHGNVAAATFGLHAQLVGYMSALLAVVIGPYWSAISDAWHRGDIEWLRKTIRSLQMLAFVVASGYSLVLLLAGRFVMEFWTNGNVAWDSTLMLLLCLNLIVQSVVGVSAMTLGALGIAKQTAVVVCVHALLHVILTVVLTHMFGLHGLAAGALISYLVTSGWFVAYKLKAIAFTDSR